MGAHNKYFEDISKISVNNINLKNGLELPLMEAFLTVQGEGYFAGQPSYFLRVGGCDVGCHWCDVKESWDPNLHPLTKVDDIIKETIKETLNEWFAKNLKSIVEESVKEEVAKLFKKRN